MSYSRRLIMLKRTKYFPDKGLSALQKFYREYPVDITGDNSLVSQSLKELEKIQVARKAEGKLAHLFPIWVREFDTDCSVNNSDYNSKVLLHKENKKFGDLLVECTYSSLCKKLVELAKINKLNYKIHRSWLIRFGNPKSDFYCSNFYNDILKVDPRIKQLSVGDDDVCKIRKAWLCIYLEHAEYHPYPTIKKDKNAETAANKKYTLPRLTARKNSPQTLFEEYCYPDSENFDGQIFEFAFGRLKYKVDKSKPDESVKDLIVRVLSHGDFIDSPLDTSNQCWTTMPKQHKSLYYWFDRYTNTESKFYDEKFTKKLQKEYPQQFTLKSLKFTGHRSYDRKKEEFIKKLTQNPTITYNEVKGFIRNQTGIIDPIFYEICEKIRKDYSTNKPVEPTLVVITPKGKFYSRAEARKACGLSVWQLGDKIRNSNNKEYYEKYE